MTVGEIMTIKPSEQEKTVLECVDFILKGYILTV